jgi:plasmid stabilization system protein ParE
MNLKNPEAKWGLEQVTAYREQLEARLTMLAKFPEIGHANINLPTHILYVTTGKHYVFYRIVHSVPFGTDPEKLKTACFNYCP